MLVLALDTATPTLVAGLARWSAEAGAEVLAERSVPSGNKHAELLTPAIRGALADAGLTLADVEAVVTGLGPGPFTGLRVGLVTAAALGDGLGIPTYGVCSLDGLGWGQAGTVLVATDARRKELYWALYSDGERIAGPAVDRPDVVAARAAESGVTLAIGDGAHRYPLGFAVNDEPRYPRPEALAALAADRIRAKAVSEPLTPLYLRRPDATLPSHARKPVLQ